MNSAKYIDILENILTRSLSKLELAQNDFVFQQDNAPCHVSKISKKYFEDHRINLMDWPSNSQDIYPIENSWSLIKLRISKENPQNKRD